ncbi:hypothetical protein ACWKSP_31710 [Micromonosporaceae bacterium Da 78-11]
MATSALVLVSVLTTAATPAPAVTARARIAPTFNGGVYAVAHQGDIVYVGGAFTSAIAGGRSYPRQRLAAFDARSGALLNWAPTTDGTVRALATTGDSVFAAGDFHKVSGFRRDALVRLHPLSGAVTGGFDHDIAGTPYALAVANDRLYLGGSFNQVDGVKRRNLAAFALVGGRLDTRWRPAADDTVHALAVSGPKVYLGGGFHTVDDVRGTLRLAAVNGASGVVDRRFLPKAPAEVRAITVDGGSVYVATGGIGGKAISYTYAGLLRWQRVFDGDVAAIAVERGTAYIGGHFDSICLTNQNGVHGACTDGSLPRVKLAAVTAVAGLLTPWAPRANGVIGVRVLSLNRSAGTLEAGGDFTMIDGQDRHRFATF